MTVEVSAGRHVQIRVGLLRLAAPIALVAALHAMEDVHRVIIYARIHVQVDALQDAERAARTLVNQMQPVVVLYQLVPVLALHAHLIAMGRAEIIAKVPIFQQVPQQKIQVHHAQHAELPVVLIAVKYVLAVMAVVPVNV